MKIKAKDLVAGQRFIHPNGLYDNQECIVCSDNNITTGYIPYIPPTPYDIAILQKDIEVEASFPNCLSLNTLMGLAVGTPIVFHHEHLKYDQKGLFTKIDKKILYYKAINKDGNQYDTSTHLSDCGAVPYRGVGISPHYNTTNWVEIDKNPILNDIHIRDMEDGQVGIITAWGPNTTYIGRVIQLVKKENNKATLHTLGKGLGASWENYYQLCSMGENFRVKLIKEGECLRLRKDGFYDKV